MSKIGDIRDKIGDIIAATLATDYKRLPNPHVIDVNTHLHMKKGYGIAAINGTNTQRYVGCLTTWERVYRVVLIHQVTATQNNTDARIQLDQNLLDDHELLLKAFEANPSIDGVAIKSIITDDSGIAFIDLERLKFLTLEMNIAVEYQFDPRS